MIAMATTTTTTEQLPAYSANAQPGFTPANGGDDALLPQYTFPTKFKIGAFFTDGLLVNIEQIKGHLALLHAFSNLKVEVENLPSGSIVNMPGNREQRWAWFVGLAAERYVSIRLHSHLEALIGIGIALISGHAPCNPRTRCSPSKILCPR